MALVNITSCVHSYMDRSTSLQVVISYTMVTLLAIRIKLSESVHLSGYVHSV